MEKSELTERLTAIGQCTDDVERRELLTALMTDAGADYDNLTALAAENKTLTDDNETLRSANMKLFLRVGDNSKTPDERKKDVSGVDDKEETKKSFADLFDEKGGIK